MARPRGITDEQLLAAAQDLLYEVGPAAFTLEKSAAADGTTVERSLAPAGSLASRRRLPHPEASVPRREPLPACDSGDFPERERSPLSPVHRAHETAREESGRKCRCHSERGHVP